MLRAIDFAIGSPLSVQNSAMAVSRTVRGCRDDRIVVAIGR